MANKSKSDFRGYRPEYRELARMNYRDLKIACIVRGMEFEDVVEGDHNSLQAFFIKHYHDLPHKDRLERFDNWMDKQLAKKYPADDPFRAFRLSSVLDDTTEEPKVKAKIKKALPKTPKKPRREKNSTFNVFKGTKKEYTMELTHKLLKAGKNMESKKLQQKLVEAVIKKFPDANEKSIIIWYKRVVKNAPR